MPDAAHQSASPRSCILGTAGHIDHGKSALVKALTGTDPDRLPEEQARGMTIVLGYAHLALPDPAGGPPWCIGIVDVPGHERFVRTMVAGATGIDLAMLVIAADDGVMPQTREHVDILDLLGVHIGLIALSKVDIVQPSRIAAVREQIAAMTNATPLERWPIVEYSARTGQGLDDVRAAIARLVGALPQRETGKIFRLPIDRVFAIHGRGTVVTGSALAGTVAPGATLELHPLALTCKVREVQSYGAAVTDAHAGQRTALNLTGVERAKIERGMELATPGYLSPSRYVDGRVRILRRREKPFASHQRVRVSMGTTEEMAMLVVVAQDAIAPGEEALVQLRFQRPVVCAFGQRFILRNETAQNTIGGGWIVRPASRRFRATHTNEIDALKEAESVEPLVRLDQALRQAGFEPRSDVRLSCEIGLPPDRIEPLRQQLRAAGKLVTISHAPAAQSSTAVRAAEVHVATLQTVQDRALGFLMRHHKTNPTEPGILRDRLVTWLDKRTFDGMGRTILARIEAAGLVAARGPYVAHHAFRPALSPEDAALLEKLVAEIAAARFDPPAWDALKSTTGLSKQRLKVLEDVAKTEPRLVMFEPQHYISADAVNEFKQTVRKLAAGRRFKLSEVRDALGLSRRVVQPLLEHLDRVGFCKRVGEERVLLERGS